MRMSRTAGKTGMKQLDSPSQNFCRCSVTSTWHDMYARLFGASEEQMSERRSLKQFRETFEMFWRRFKLLLCSTNDIRPNRALMTLIFVAASHCRCATSFMHDVTVRMTSLVGTADVGVWMFTNRIKTMRWAYEELSLESQYVDAS